ncbi:hypothetical protein COLO4_33377 [Corchorus olitorius]|uniref:F-box domain-containing protein n=1 Tax=Corchorus olitorius TaxID=93759 RepID=A0A1R3GUC5_9ROSI|nr:hypothetical protein COLO4_33377 [Corchorus olitorius]
MDWLTQVLQDWFPWLKQKQIPEINPLPDLPDDLMLEIFTRLPATQVLNCQKVCRAWLRLSSTQDFAKQHLLRAIPILFAHYTFPLNLASQFKLNFFFLDRNATEMDQVCPNFPMQRMSMSHLVLVGSCNGLLVFTALPRDNSQDPSIIYVCNPTTQEVIVMSKPLVDGYCCGIYFHSSTKEYRILYVTHGNEYLILTVGKTGQRSVGTFACSPSKAFLPITFNKNLHWMVMLKEEEVDTPSSCAKFIMVYNVETEEFNILPHPEAQQTLICSKIVHENMKLIEMDGGLSFWWSFRDGFLHGWVLIDYDRWDWTRTFMINIDSIAEQYPCEAENPMMPPYDIKLVNIKNNQLLLVWSERGVFRYDLETGIIQKIKLPRINKFNHKKELLSLTSYTESFISLNT